MSFQSKPNKLFIKTDSPINPLKVIPLHSPQLPYQKDIKKNSNFSNSLASFPSLSPQLKRLITSTDILTERTPILPINNTINCKKKKIINQIF